MSPRRCKRRLSRFLLTIVCFSVVVLRLPLAAADDDARLFEVFINGRTTNLQADFVQHGKRLTATVDDLKSLGLRTDGLHPGADGQVSLDQIPGLTYEIDERHQILRLTLADSRLVGTDVGEKPVPAAPAMVRPELGALLNYQSTVTEVSGRAQTSTSFDSRLSTDWGVASSTWLVQTGLPLKAVTRLDTAFTHMEVDSMRRWQVGDVITGGLSWTRPVRLGGVQVSSDFRTRPDLVTYPVPLVAGRTDVPSTVDVFVNSVRQLSQNVDSGPFQLRQPPVMTGASDVAVVVQDVTGQQHVQNLSFYITPSLLSPGLASYSMEGGMIRENYALPGDRYVGAAVSGTVRYGVTRWLTAEAHAEGTNSVAMGGVGLAVNVFNLGTGSAAIAASNPAPSSVTGSRRTRTPGGQVTVGLERSGRWLTIGASTTLGTKGFQDVAATAQNPVPTMTLQANLGLALGDFGAIRTALIATRSKGVLLPQFGLSSEVEASPGHATILSVSYTRPITPTLQFALNGYHDFSAHGTSGITFGLSMPLGQRSAASLQGGLNGNEPFGSLDASQVAVSPGDFGWRAQLSRNPTMNEDGQVSYMTPFGTVAGEVDRTGSQTGLRAQAIGSLITTTDGPFAANRVGDSYAVVDTGGVPNVGVMQENRLVGHTDAHGLLLLPDLQGWQANRITLDPADLPGDVTGNKLEQVVHLASGAGGRVMFDLHRGQNAIVRLVDGAGKPLAPGGVGSLNGGDSVPVGYDGELFLAGLKPNNVLRVRTLAGDCIARFPFKPETNTLPVIGPLPCTAESSK
jgi:outer membrane usher protein